MSIILQVHFCYTETNPTPIFIQNPLAADRKCAFRWKTVLPPLFYWIRARTTVQCAYSWVVSSWNNTNPHYEYMYTKYLTTQSTFFASGGKISFILLVEFGRKHISASFYRFNFGNLKFRTSFYWNIILLIHFWKQNRLRRPSFYWGIIFVMKSRKIIFSKSFILLEHHFTGYVL